jgi:predicted MFS family arabinose efflux permease
VRRPTGTGPSTGLGTYLRLVAPGAGGRPFAAATIARLPISMTPLGIVLLVQHVTGSYAQAGTVTGAFAFGTAAGAPLWGRALDRWGQPRVIAPTATLSAAFVAALALAAGHAPLGVLVAFAALAGLAFPPMTPAMRAAWREAVPDTTQQRAAYALDAVSVETIFIAGPLLLSLLLVVSPGAVPLLVTSSLLLLGGLAYVTTAAARGAVAGAVAGAGATAPERPHLPVRRRLRLDVLLPPGLLPVLVTSLGMAIAFGAIDTALAATARDVLHDQAKLGVLFAAIAGGSATSGLWFGTRDVTDRSQIRFLPFLLLAFACGLTPLSVLFGESTPALPVLLPLLFLTGLAISPTLIILQNLVDVAAPAARTNEGQAWLSTSVTTGAGVGTAGAGFLVDLGGVPWAFAAAGSAALVAAAMAGRLRRRHSRSTWPPAPSTPWSTT